MVLFMGCILTWDYIGWRIHPQTKDPGMVIKKHQRWSLLSCCCKILQGSMNTLQIFGGWVNDGHCCNELADMTPSTKARSSWETFESEFPLKAMVERVGMCWIYSNHFGSLFIYLGPSFEVCNIRGLGLHESRITHFQTTLPSVIPRFHCIDSDFREQQASRRTTYTFLVGSERFQHHERRNMGRDRSHCSPPARWGLLDFNSELFSSSSSASCPPPPPRPPPPPLVSPRPCLHQLPPPLPPCQLFAKLFANSLRQALCQLPSSVCTGTSTWDLPSSVCTAGPQAQCAPLDLNQGPSQLSVHRWTSTWDLPSPVCTAGPQPGICPAQCALLDLNRGPPQLSVHCWTSTGR